MLCNKCLLLFACLSGVQKRVPARANYPSHQGWDACTGLGTIDGAALLWVIRSGKTKILDDVTLKASEDTNKVIDDKSKIADDVTLIEAPIGGTTFKFADDGGMVRSMEEVKIPGRDVGPLPRAGAPGTPFILATPHHAMVWLGAGGAWHGAPPSVYQAMIAQYEAEFTRLEQAMQKASSELQGLDAQYRQMLEAYRALVKGYLALPGLKTAAQDIGS